LKWGCVCLNLPVGRGLSAQCKPSQRPRCRHQPPFSRPERPRLPQQLRCSEWELRRSRCLPPALPPPRLAVQPRPSDSFSTDSVLKYLFRSVLCRLFFRNAFPRVSGVMLSHAGAGTACCGCQGGRGGTFKGVGRRDVGAQVLLTLSRSWSLNRSFKFPPLA